MTTVVTAPVASITVTGAGSAITVVNRSTLQMSGAVLPSYATNQVLSWSITNGTGTATIDSSTGLLSALGAGTVTVNASATDGSGITGTLVVTVTAAPGGGRGSASISFASNISSTNTTTTSIISPSSPSSPSSTTSIVSITPSSSNSYNFGTTTLKNGSKGEAVKELQRFLNDKLNLGLEIDGVLGSKTIAVIKKWQKENGLVPDGLIGSKTKALMNNNIITTSPTTSTSSNSYNFGTSTLKNGSKGETVKELQRFLNDKLNLGLEIDGVLGPKTISVIKKWQKDNGLTPDGLIGAKTKALMNTLVPSVGIEPTSRP